VPSYLDRLQAGHHDLPILLLPVINELRAAYNANIVSEATLFAPDLDVELPELEQAADEHAPAFDEPFGEFALRMRRQWENALLRWLQHQEDPDLLAPLHSVCETLQRRLERLDLKRVWWVAAEVIGGLLDGVTDNDVHLRRLFARLHLILKALVEGGEDGVEAQSANSVSQALLFHIAQAKPGSAGVDRLRERFNLQELVPDRDVLVRARGAVTGRNAELYLSLGSAVRDELSLVKDALDLELRTGTIEPTRREQSHDALLRLEDTLKMLGLADSARSIEKLMPAFDASEDPEADPDQRSRESLLMGLAEQLIQVESVLEEQISTLGEPLPDESASRFIDLPVHEIRRIRSHLLDETVTSLHQVQDAVRQYFDGALDADFTVPMEHIAGALELIGEVDTAGLATKLRNALANVLRVSRSEAEIAPDKLEAVTDAVAALELYLAACRDQQKNRERFVDILEARLERLPVGEMEAVEAAAPPPDETREAPAEAAAAPSDIDPELLAVFLEEYEAVTGALAETIPGWLNKPADIALMTEIRRAFHTLKGSGRMVGANELGEYAWRVEALLNATLEGRIETGDDTAVVLRLSEAVLPELRRRLVGEDASLDAEGTAAIEAQLQAIESGSAADWAALLDLLPPRLARLLPGGEAIADADEKALDVMMREELGAHLAVLKALLDQASRNRRHVASEAGLVAAHSIAGTVTLAPVQRELEVAKVLGAFLDAQRKSGNAFNDTAIWALAAAVSYLETCLAIHEGDTEARFDDDIDQQLAQLQALTAEYRASAAVAAAVAEAEEAEEAEEEPAEAEAEGPAELEAEPAADEDVVDPEILGIFLEEANLILERWDTLLNTWRDDLQDLGIVQNLQREIHTFKGGARMAGLSALGDLSHSMETLLERIAGRMLPPSVSAIEALEQGCDQLNAWTETVGQGILPQAGNALMLFAQRVDALAAVPLQPAAPAQPAPPPVEEEAPSAEQPEEALLDIPEAPAVEEAEPVAEPAVAGGEEPVVPQHIRVSAELLDSLVNSAGEISICRSRLEQQVGAMRDNLKEFDETVSRLRDQFRKLEMETETQIRSRYQHEIPDESDEFDPLEMDRFSAMQQLSRSLTESVSDLLNLQEILDDAAARSEALLVQQSRVSADLQEGLMQTRMVHFGTIAPRLRRIIRTAAKESRKKALLNLRMTGGGDMLDRNVLERITAPLEHLLRNAIVHGIETPAQRRKARKPEEGQLTITVASEATEFVIRVEDDGAGMDFAAIRKKAIESGLLQKDADPQPQQLLQFILHSGFSTSKKVTKLAGRGVGMDVVNSEIKQIGGSVEIESEAGKGSCFIIRIPFTLAVMQAIGVTAGGHPYLIPVSSVAGVARILPADYQSLLEADKPEYGFAGQSYPILELEPLLGEPSTPMGDDTISILMIKSGNQRAAFRVPELLGHQEIVIKPVGPQISSVPGILGGTITGNGQVVVIIDAGPLIRQAMLTGARPAPAMENVDLRPPRTLALVVDDSITMRKVTRRVLEAYDFEVITARDGVEAVEEMRERVPDLILLDIEMPRMDGYQVAEHVRGDARLRQVPIIMITSRAGKKHRDRGKEAGANAYLSKPYKESELIDEIRQLLKNKAD
jgi:chemosensory pili system protein ChpA (sensor histidine kinase/response regulator)